MWHRCRCGCAPASTSIFLQLIATFSSDSDLVFSDIVAGLLLLAEQAASVPVTASAAGDVASIPVLASSTPPAWMTAQSGAYFVNFAIGVYGWPTYFLNNCCSWWRLLRGAFRCAQCAFCCCCCCR